MIRCGTILLLATLATAAPVVAAAEEAILACFFDYMCDPDRACADAALDLRYRLDLETNAVAPVGATDGLSEFNLVIGDRALSIVEVELSGGMTVTTFLTDSGTAVHSSNAIDGTLLATGQYLGSCSLS